MTTTRSVRQHLGPRSLTFFWIVMTLGLAFQAFWEMVIAGLGSGISPASTAFYTVPFAAVPTTSILFVGLVYQGFGLVLRAIGYAVSLHGLLCGYLWTTLSTPMDSEAFASQWVWLNSHPDQWGIGLIILSAMTWLALISTSYSARRVWTRPTMGAEQ